MSIPVLPNDASGTVATGGTAQDALAANKGRVYLFIQNLDAAEDLWVNIGATAAVATPGSLLIVAKGSLVYEAEVCVTGRVSVIAATTAHPFTLKHA